MSTNRDTSEASEFLTDSPITTRDEDILHRRGFAEQLAHRVARWDGERALVIALRGEWGSGKTSLVNMATDALMEHHPDVRVLVFDCWEWAGHEEIATAFFTELGRALGNEDRQLAKSLAAYAERINAVSAAASAVRPIAGAIGAVLTAAGVGLSFLDSAGDATGPILAIVGAMAVVTSQFREVWSRISQAWANPKPTLERLKKDVVDRMKDLAWPIVVVIDDIDRLAPANAMRVLQVVRANGDLPKLVYLVPFDRDVLAKAAESEVPGQGEAFLERLAQVPFDVPSVRQGDLDVMVFKVIDILGGRPEVSVNWNRDTFLPIYRSSLAKYVTTPRRAALLSSTLPFMVDLHSEGESFEVNFGDLICLEILRLFEGAVYARLPAAGAVLTGSSSGDERERQRALENINGILAMVPEEDGRRAQVGALLGWMFPSVLWATSNTGYHFDTGRRLRERRISDPSVFPTYFLLAVDPTTIPEARVRNIIDTMPNGVECMSDELRLLGSDQLIGPFLDRVRVEHALIPQEHLIAFIAALFNVGDELASRMVVFGHASESLRAVFLIEELLEQQPNDDRFGILKSAFEASSGIALPVELVRLQLHRHEKDREPTFEIGDLQSLMPDLMQRIQRDAGSGALLRSSRLIETWWAWNEWDAESANIWMETTLRSPRGLAAILRAHRTSTESHGEVERVKFNLTNISRHGDLSALAQRAGTYLESEEPDPWEAETLAAFVDAVGLHQKGQYSIFDRFPDANDPDAEPPAQADEQQE